MVASYTLPWDISAGRALPLRSGPLVTPVVGSLFDVNGNYYFPLPGMPWSQRLPDFFQLDVRVDKRFVFDAWTLVVYVDVQNVTNQQNPEGAVLQLQLHADGVRDGIPILPTVGVRGEW